VPNRGPIIEFSLVCILLIVLGALTRSLLPDVHQLLRFAITVAVTVPLVLGVHALMARYGPDADR
jgi:O-antigen ligase